MANAQKDENTHESDQSLREGGTQLRSEEDGRINARAQQDEGNHESDDARHSKDSYQSHDEEDPESRTGESEEERFSEPSETAADLKNSPKEVEQDSSKDVDLDQLQHNIETSKDDVESSHSKNTDDNSNKHVGQDEKSNDGTDVDNQRVCTVYTIIFVPTNLFIWCIWRFLWCGENTIRC